MPKIVQVVGAPDQHVPKKTLNSCMKESEEIQKRSMRKMIKSDENGPENDENHCQNQSQT